MNKITNNLEDLIEYLQEIQAKYKQHKIPVAINLYSDRILALKSICLDNDDISLGLQLFFEADMEDRAEMSDTIQVYEQTDKYDRGLDYALYCTEDGTLDIFDTYSQADEYIKENLQQTYIDEIGLNRYVIFPMKQVKKSDEAEVVLYNATDGMFSFATELLNEDLYNSDLADADVTCPVLYIHDMDR